MKQPLGFIDKAHPTHVCKLHKAIYGLKQSPRQWYSKLTSHLQTFGFNFSRSDPSLLYTAGSTRAFILIYVDDMLVTSNDPQFIQQLFTNLKQAFNLKDPAPASLFLGIRITAVQSGTFLD
ncbi:hypothetical protein KFK09_025069 [Dendrobium nobile]|uniref:Reverse transcriptase Ty1/copia-type domain-containing protein n=1 Tax=Dendrobium nobile TaxID=94219 RepID=A0A8T3AFL8_DENNO|nr:hypothetical protein KFK09_025069 [Dendrobium nobile]